MPTWFIWPYRWNLHNTFNLHYAVVPAFPISFCIRIDETSRYLLEGGGVRRFLFWWEGGEEIIWFSGEIGKVSTMTGNKGDLKNTPEPQGESGKLSIWNNQNPPPPKTKRKIYDAVLRAHYQNSPPPHPSPIASLWPRGSISKPNFTAGLLTLPVSASPLSNPSPPTPPKRHVPNGQCAKLQVERPEFKTWPGHCVLFLGKALSSLRSGV